MWVRLAVCRLVAPNVGSVAPNVSLTGDCVAPNVGRKWFPIAGQPLDDCGPLQLADDVA